MTRSTLSNAPSSFLGKAGVVAAATVKHVPTRVVLWGALGLLVGVVGVALSYVLGVVTMGRGALLLGYLAAIPFAIPPLGAVLFGIHGLHRGAAHAALALEAKFGLVAHLTGRVLAQLEDRFGEQLANLPLQQLEAALKDVVAHYLATNDEEFNRDKGLLAYVLRRARISLTRKIEGYLLAAYREELNERGAGGGVSLEKVRDRTNQEISSRLGELVLAPLNKQLAVLLTLYLLLAVGWWFWLMLIIGGVGTLTSHPHA